MASYPGAVKTFTSRNAGDTIQPSHVNDLQDEVNAIEAGLLQGTANLNSSNSTVVNLSVSGSSTIAGTLNVANQPRCVLSNGSSFVLANNTWTGLSFQSETLNNGPLHSTTTNSSRITFAGSTGTYLFTGSVAFDASASTGIAAARIVQNDTTDISGRVFAPLGSFGAAGPTLTVTTIARIVSTSDYVGLFALQASGSTLGVTYTFAACRLC